MIRINLLPVEMRTSERTPLPRFLAMIGVIVLVLGVWVAVVKRYMDVASLREQRDGLSVSLTNLNTTVEKEWQPLKNRLALLDKRLAANKTLEKERTIGGVYPWMWTQAIDEVWDVIWKSPRVWITNINCIEGGGGAGLPAGTKVEATMSMDAYAATKDFSGMTEFRRRLQEHPNITKRFKYMNPPTQVTVETDDTIKEGGKVKFRIELYAVQAAAATAKK